MPSSTSSRLTRRHSMISKPLAVLTGSTRGIGLSIAIELAERGFVPILNYRDDEDAAQSALSRIVEVCPDAIALRADVTTWSGVKCLFAAASQLGSVDVLVNNVGKFLYKPFAETSPADWHEILDSNLMSAVLCCQAALPAMRRRAKGHIVNIAAMHAERRRSRPNTLPYAIAKSGVIYLTETLAVTEGPYGIRVNAVCPGFISGGDYSHAEHADAVPLGRLGRPQEIAKAVGFLVSDSAAYITGAVLNIHGGALL
jgi:3-oxoacyl-[acyl-carrier protein] reductase